MWHNRVREVYSSLEELQGYDETFGIVERCGYASAEELWNDNPMLQGSTNPEDFGLSKRTKLRNKS